MGGAGFEGRRADQTWHSRAVGEFANSGLSPIAMRFFSPVFLFGEKGEHAAVYAPLA